jgi:hypothetical protein
MTFAPSLFLSNIKAKDGLARPNRFQVILPIPTYINSFIEQGVLEQLINLPNNLVADITSIVTSALGNNPQDPQSKTSNASISRYLSMQCETAELPGKSLVTADVKIYGPTFKVPYQKQFAETTLGFLSTNDFYERKLFDRWIDAIMPSSTNNLRFAKDNDTRYLTNIKIIQYDDFIKQIYAVELIDAFPTAVVAQPLSWSDDNFHRLSIQFSYQRYRTLYDGEYDLAQAAASIFGAKAANLFDRVFRF